MRQCNCLIKYHVSEDVVEIQVNSIFCYFQMCFIFIRTLTLKSDWLHH